MTAETMDATKNELIDGRDEILAAEAHERAGTMHGDVPEGFVRVVAVARHKQRYEDGTETLRLPGQQYDLQREKLARGLEIGLVHLPDAFEFDWWKANGRILAAEPCDAEPLMDAPSDGALKIIAGAGYDPGSAAFRLHTAINETTKHASAFVRWGDTNPHCSLRQLDGVADAPRVRQAVLEADVIHHHVVQFLANNTGIAPREDQLVIRHYHGSKEGGGSHLEPIWDRAHGYKLLGARLSLVAEAKAEGLEMDWSPIPVPVGRYRALRDAARANSNWRPLEGAATAQRPLVIAHSPTNERIKGSSVLRDVVRQLQAKGVPVEVEWIRGVSLAESLRRKALCDVCFDSFWLGIQGSGLEAGAMEMPVIAGDPDVAALYREEIGDVPYTFANDASQLADVLELIATEAGYRAMATERVSHYVEQFHDYARVAERYEESLSKWLGRDVRTRMRGVKLHARARVRDGMLADFEMRLIDTFDHDYSRTHEAPAHYAQTLKEQMLRFLEREARGGELHEGRQCFAEVMLPADELVLRDPSSAPIHIQFTHDETVLHATGDEAAAILSAASPMLGEILSMRDDALTEHVIVDKGSAVGKSTDITMPKRAKRERP